MADVGKANNWRIDFGVGDYGPKAFFASKTEMQAPNVDASQSHILWRAFDLLRLEGVLCAENVPLVYFKEVNRIEVAEVCLPEERVHNGPCKDLRLSRAAIETHSQERKDGIPKLMPSHAQSTIWS
jgi:hypothetical protein